MAADAPGEAAAFGMIDGVETAIGVGSVLAQATLRDSKCVVNAPVTVGARVPNGSAGSVIIWVFDEECRAVIQEIRPGQVGDKGRVEGGQSESPHQGSHGANVSSSIETRTGWVSYYIGEQFDLAATKVHTEMGYEDYGDSVGGGHATYAQCWASLFPLWNIEDCYAVYYSYGLDYVWIEITGEFSHSLNIDYTQYAQRYGMSNGYSHTCTLTEGSLPPLWEEICYGGVID